MDNCGTAFVVLLQLLSVASAGLPVPQGLSADLENGFLVVSWTLPENTSLPSGGTFTIEVTQRDNNLTTIAQTTETSLTLEVGDGETRSDTVYLISVGVIVNETAGNFSHLVYVATSGETHERSPPSPGGNGRGPASLAIAGVIGVSAVVVLTVLLVIGLVYCVYRRDRVADFLDAVEYSSCEEYEARLNTDALQALDPAIRSKMDFNLLAKLSNTDPAELMKYAISTGDESGIDQTSSIRRKSSSISRYSIGSLTSRSSVHRHAVQSTDNTPTQSWSHRAQQSILQMNRKGSDPTKKGDIPRNSSFSRLEHYSVSTGEDGNRKRRNSLSRLELRSVSTPEEEFRDAQELLRILKDIASVEVINDDDADSNTPQGDRETT